MLISPKGLCQERHDDVKPIETTFCYVATHPAVFDGKRVLFRAGVESDGLENTILVDRKCKLVISPHLKNDADVLALDRAIDVGFRGTLDKRVFATFKGTFVRKGQKRILEVEEITNIEVIPLRK